MSMTIKPSLHILLVWVLSFIDLLVLMLKKIYKCQGLCALMKWRVGFMELPNDKLLHIKQMTFYYFVL